MDERRSNNRHAGLRFAPSLRSLLFLLLQLFPTLATTTSESQNHCVRRCDKITSQEWVADTDDNECWQTADRLACLQPCGVDQWSELDELGHHCRRLLAKNMALLECVARESTEIRSYCSNHVQNAVTLLRTEESVEDRLGVCKHLRYHAVCLDHAVSIFCPDLPSDSLSLLHHLRSLSMPDRLDEMSLLGKGILDSCSSHTSTTRRHVSQPGMVSIHWAPILPKTVLPFVAPPTRRPFASPLFSPEQELVSDAPNFGYSSARYETSSYRRSSAEALTAPTTDRPPAFRLLEDVKNNNNDNDEEPFTIRPVFTIDYEVTTPAREDDELQLEYPAVSENPTPFLLIRPHRPQLPSSRDSYAELYEVPDKRAKADEMDDEAEAWALHETTESVAETDGNTGTDDDKRRFLFEVVADDGTTTEKSPTTSEASRRSGTDEGHATMVVIYLSLFSIAFLALLTICI